MKISALRSTWIQVLSTVSRAIGRNGFCFIHWIPQRIRDFQVPWVFQRNQHLTSKAKEIEHCDESIQSFSLGIWSESPNLTTHRKGAAVFYASLANNGFYTSEGGEKMRSGQSANRQVLRNNRTDSHPVAGSFPKSRHRRVGRLGPQQTNVE